MIRILAGVGIALLLVAAVAVHMLGPILIAPSGAENKETAVSIVRDMSRNWSVGGLEGRMTQHALDSIASEIGQSEIRKMSGLGRLINADNIVQTKLIVGTRDGTVATIHFRGAFENGTSDVTVVLKLIDDQMKLDSLSLPKIDLRQASSVRMAA